MYLIFRASGPNRRAVDCRGAPRGPVKPDFRVQERTRPRCDRASYSFFFSLLDDRHQDGKAYIPTACVRLAEGACRGAHNKATVTREYVSMQQQYPRFMTCPNGVSRGCCSAALLCRLPHVTAQCNACDGHGIHVFVNATAAPCFARPGPHFKLCMPCSVLHDAKACTADNVKFYGFAEAATAVRPGPRGLQTGIRQCAHVPARKIRYTVFRPATLGVLARGIVQPRAWI